MIPIRIMYALLLRKRRPGIICWYIFTFIPEHIGTWTERPWFNKNVKIFMKENVIENFSVKMSAILFSGLRERHISFNLFRQAGWHLSSVNCVIIGWGNGLSPVQCQAITYLKFKHVHSRKCIWKCSLYPLSRPLRVNSLWLDDAIWQHIDHCQHWFR